MNLGTLELIVIVGLLLVLYGEKLPEVTKALGRGFREMKRSLNEIKENISPMETIRKNIKDELFKTVQIDEITTNPPADKKNTVPPAALTEVKPTPDLPYPDHQNRPG
ncbi:MAG: twin-arginine translocase TatA/TatE family subunit [Planctomycetota bacterium]